MLKALMKGIGLVALSTLMASAIVLTTLHQSFWQYQPVSYKYITQAVHKVEAESGACSGVMIAPNKMLTAAHCKNLGSIQVNGKPTAILKVDEASDLMLLLVDVPCPCVKMTNVEPVEGQEVSVIGYPLGLAKSRADGRALGAVDSGLYIEGFSIYVANIEGGFSGGGIFYFHNKEWYLVGIVSGGSKTLLLAPTTTMLNNFLKGSI
jgi:hypothetical protein